MKFSQKLSISALSIAIGVAGFFGYAAAATPNLSVSQPDANNIVRITVSNADPFSTVGFYQQQGSGPLVFVSNYGQTDSSGFFSQLATLSNNGSGSSIQEYVIVNGQRSNTVTVYPNGYYGGYGNGSVVLSQSNLSLNAGQSATITVTSSAYAGNSFYFSNSGNSSVATASISGNTITVYGISAGSTTFTVCQINNSQCASLYVTVNGGFNNSGITFSISNPNLNVGQSMSLNIFSNSNSGNSYYVSSGSGNIVNATISGNTLNLLGMNPGSANVTVCQINNSQCGNLYVTVSGSYGGGAVSFSNTNPSLNVGQTTSVSVFANNGNNSSFYVSSNSNNNAVSASISSNTLNLTGLSNGSATINVCQFNTNICGSLYATVGGSGQFTLSQNNVSMNVGQTLTVTANNSLGGFNSFYVSTNSNPNVVSASISGNVISLYALNFGTSNISICQNTGNFQCQNLYVNVNNNYSGSGVITFSPANPVLNIGQSASILINSNSGYSYNNYYISTNSNPSVASASISGSTMYLLGNAAGSTNITVCQYSTSQCSTVFVSVNSSGSGSVLGANIFANGTLINDNGTIYITYKNTKTGFANAAAFAGLGYSFKNVVNANTSQLTPSSFVIASQFIAHPWGTWILNGGTVYFSEQNGLVPVPDYNTFINNGGSFDKVVTANSYDMQRPIESVMILNDSRLR